MTPETVAARALSDHACALGEGATYDAASDTAWWFDILERTLFEHRFRTGETVTHPLPFMASQLSFVDDGRQLLASETGLHLREIATGRLSLVAGIEADDLATRSNDGRVHPSGALWISTMGKRAERQAGTIYWFCGGVLKVLYSGITIPNAIAFSPDGRTAYFTDTDAGLLLRVEIDPETGMPKGEPATLHDHRGEDGGQDGAVVDAEGVIWNACWGAGRIDAYSPNGERLRSIGVPARQPSCPAFIGARLDRMLVTTAQQGLDAEALAADPEAGRTLILDLPVRGKAEPRVRLG